MDDRWRVFHESAGHHSDLGRDDRCAGIGIASVSAQFTAAALTKTSTPSGGEISGTCIGGALDLAGRAMTEDPLT